MPTFWGETHREKDQCVKGIGFVLCVCERIRVLLQSGGIAKNRDFSVIKYLINIIDSSSWCELSVLYR